MDEGEPLISPVVTIAGGITDDDLDESEEKPTEPTQPTKSKRQLKRERKRKERDEKKAWEPKHVKRRKQEQQEQGVISADQLQETTFLYEHGLRKVTPYKYTYSVYAKPRWFGKPAIEVYTTEFRQRTRDYYVHCFKQGFTQINHRAVHHTYKIQQGDEILHRLHRHEPPVTAQPIDVVYEDDNLIVIDKPGSIPIHPSGRYRHNTIVFHLAHDRNLRHIYIVHRLDRLTSGVLLLAKSSKYANEVSAKIRGSQVQKVYLARVSGVFPEGKIEVNQPLFNDHGVTSSCKVDPINGKESLTYFERLSTNGVESVVRCLPKTGRTHQIRVHLQWLGFPISNDPIYNPVHRAKCRENPYVLENEDEEAGDGPIPAAVMQSKSAAASAATPSTEPAPQQQNEEYEPIQVDISSLDPQPLCLDCIRTFKDPAPEDLFIYLHALTYTAPEWTYTTKQPQLAFERVSSALCSTLKMADDGFRARQIPQEVYQKYQQLRQTYTGLAQRLAECDADKAEHETVLKTISELDKDRKCFRLVGGVLVERTVGEVYPAVKQSRDNLAKTVETLMERITEIESQLNDLSIKFGIGRDPQQAGAQKEAKDKSGGEDKPKGGVLVKI